MTGAAGAAIRVAEHVFSAPEPVKRVGAESALEQVVVGVTGDVVVLRRADHVLDARQRVAGVLGAVIGVAVVVDAVGE